MSEYSHWNSRRRMEDIAMAKVWLITGSGNGLGRDIAEAALAAGDSVVAGARRTEELAPLVAQYGQRVKPVKLEVRDEAAAKAAVRLAVDTFGRLDVLVNNAGYGQFAPFEQMNAEDFQAVVDTCFYGVVYTSRAVRSQDLHIGAGRHSDQLGTARRSECAGPAAGVRGHGRFVPQDIARPRRAIGRRSAEDRGCNSATGK